MTRSDWDAEPSTNVLPVAHAFDAGTTPHANRGHERPRADPGTTRRIPAGQVEAAPPPLDPAPAARPTRRQRNWLTRLAGADEEILSRAPADRPKFVSMGAVLIGTAAVAATSAAFAMNTAVKLTPVPAILVGLLWGLVILNLDRMLVVSMPTTAGVRRTLVTAIPRVALAAVIGAIISMPLVLRIFEYEINAELEKMRAESLSAAQVALNNDVRFAAIPQLEQEESRLIGLASGQSRGDVADDPEVKRLREAVAAKEKEFTDTENALICERGGATCGSGVPGAGPIYDELVTKLNRLRGERDQLRVDLTAATTAAQQRVDSASQQQVQVAQGDLKRVQDQLATLRADKKAAEDDVKAAEQANEGLLVRLEALDRISRGNWMMLAAHGALFLLFLSIEVLPVLMKVLSAAGPPSLYDQLLAKRDADALASADDDSVERRAAEEERRRVRDAEEEERARIMQERANVSFALEQDRAAAQIEAGKRANAELAAMQEDLAGRAIAVWGEVAATRTDEELRHWYEQHMADLRRQADGSRRASRPAESQRPEQAISYADFVARNDSGGRAARSRSRDARSTATDAATTGNTDTGSNGVSESRHQVGSDGIYRSPTAGARPMSALEPGAEPAEGRAGWNGAGPDEERDGWNADEYADDVAPPPAAPPRADR